MITLSDISMQHGRQILFLAAQAVLEFPALPALPRDRTSPAWRSDSRPEKRTAAQRLAATRGIWGN